MTANQIKYAEHLETQRHNRVSERHEHMDVRTRERTAAANERSSAANERNALTNWFAAQEQARHNTEQERVAGYSANALREFQLNQSEALLRQAGVAERNADTQFRDLANKYRTSVSSLRQAEVAERNAKIRENELAANISAVRQNVGLGYAQLGEQVRHQKAVEANEANRIFLTTNETARHNKISEGFSALQAVSSRESAQAQTQNARSNALQAQAAGRNATSNRITAVAKAVDTAANAARTFTALIGGAK